MHQFIEPPFWATLGPGVGPSEGGGRGDDLMQAEVIEAKLGNRQTFGVKSGD